MNGWLFGKFLSKLQETAGGDLTTYDLGRGICVCIVLADFCLRKSYRVLDGGRLYTNIHILLFLLAYYYTKTFFFEHDVLFFFWFIE